MKAIPALAALTLAAPLLAADPVTLRNFPRAESDHYFSGFVAKGCFAKFCHERAAASVDKQAVIRMNRDTLYSSGVFDLTTPLTVTLPDSGGRFQSMQVVSQDHYMPLVAYAAGQYVLTQESVGTRYVTVLIRTFMDPNQPKDVAAAHVVQNGITASQAAPGAFVPGDWDQAQRETLSKQLGGLMPYAKDGPMFGPKGAVDPVAHLVGTAAGWGGNPARDAIYVSRSVPQNDGVTPYELKLKDVPVDGFWSVIVYNAKGYFEAPETAISVNNVTGKRDRDGTVTVRFGGDPKAPNYLRIMPGWTYVARLYRPRASILDGSWTLPEPTPTR